MIGGAGARRAGLTGLLVAVAVVAVAGLDAWSPALRPGIFARQTADTWPSATLRTGASARPTGNLRPPAASGSSTAVTVDGRLQGAPFQGIGAISGGGGNSRYLIDYPEPARSEILNYLFKPDYGASLQMLKLEIGGDSNSSDGSEPSIEHSKGVINCDAGYEWWIAEQAVRLNPYIKLYGLQWSAPGWTARGAGTFWTRADVHYVIHWLNCAKSHGLTISYLGGRDESGYSRHWYEWMRAALNQNGYRKVQLVAADETGASNWAVAKSLARDKAFAKAVGVIGEHDTCGAQQFHCASTKTARRLHKPLWLAEQGELDPNTQAANEARVINMMYVHGDMTGLLEWPLLNAMPPGLPYENRGLVTADQPWSGNYTVNKQTWATAQTTQYVGRGWVHVGGASKVLGDSGSVVAYMSPRHADWSMVAENTGSKPGQTVKPQTMHVKVTGGLKDKVVHVRATNLESADPSQWFVNEPDITLVGGRFSYTVPAGYVVTFTTTSGQSKAGGNIPAVPPPASLPLPYQNSLTVDDGSDEPPLLAPLDGAFGLAPCDGGQAGSCLQQLTPSTPVLWHSNHLDYPYAIIGDPSWSDYTVSVDALLTQKTGTAGLIGRFTARASRATTPVVGNAIGLFEGYMLDVAENGTWKIFRNTVAGRTPVTLAAGSVAPLGVNTWHTLSLSMKGPVITAAIDGKVVGSAADPAYVSGLAGIEAGAFTGGWPTDQYRGFSVTPLR